MRFLAFLLPFQLILAACTPRVDLSRIHKGMTRNEVIDILGEPRSKFDLLGVEVLTYGDEQVTLLNDTVVQVGEDAEGKVNVEWQISPEQIDSLNRAMEVERVKE